MHRAASAVCEGKWLGKGILTLPGLGASRDDCVVIVDTTVWVDYFRGLQNPQTDWLHEEADRQRLGLTDLILCEVLQGVRDETAARHVRQELLKCEVFEAVGIPLAIEAARNYRTLRSHGHTVRKTID